MRADAAPRAQSIRARRRRRVPVVRQMSASECGAACVAMLLSAHGREVALRQVRERMGATGRDGASALAIARVARSFGLRARGARLDVEDLRPLAPGAAVLHWGFHHFVVFERFGRGFVDVVDPAEGRRRVPLARFREEYTGIALLVEPGEGFTPQERSDDHRRKYFRLMFGEGGSWASIIATSLLLQGFALAVPVLTGLIVDRVVPDGDPDLLRTLAVGLAGIVVFFFLTSVVRAHVFLETRARIDVRMMVGFIEHLVRLPYGFFQERSAGDLLMRLNSNATLRETVTTATLAGMLDGALVTLYLGVIVARAPRMAALVLALALAQILVLLSTRRRQRDLLARGLARQAAQEGYQVEMMNGIETLKALGIEDAAVERWTSLFIDVLNVSLDRGRLNAVIDSLLSTLRLSAPLTVLAVGAGEVLSGRMTLGTCLTVNALAVGLLGPMANLVNAGAQLQLMGSYVERLDDVLGTDPEQRPAAAAQIRLEGGIRLEGVGFRYAEGGSEILSDISLDVRPGTFVAILGRTGSGKSTLAKILLGLNVPTSGRVLYDGVDLSGVDLCAARRQIGVVLQRPHLFAGTVRSNIALGAADVSVEAVIEAAKSAQIHAVIERMPMGYDTVLLDGGASLSGGERQRIALARALARKPTLLLLDEATSALDPSMERAVEAELARLRCTRVVIAHRLSTVAGADLICVMDEGRIVERGTHAELLARGRAYSALVADDLRVK